MKSPFEISIIKHFVATLGIGCFLLMGLAHAQEPGKEKAQGKSQPKKNLPATGGKVGNPPMNEDAATSDFEIIRLRNANAKETASLVRGFLGGFGPVTVSVIEDPRTNSLLVSGGLRRSLESELFSARST